MAALAAHTLGALHRVAVMPAEPAPERAERSAVDYYSPDARFSSEVNDDRVRSAQEAARGHADPRGIVARGERVWRELRPQLDAAPENRVVRTRHGDAMLLTDFLATRVVELVLHGLDLADALERAPWTAPEALAVVEGLLTERADKEALARTGLSGLRLVRAATGRELPGDPGRPALAGTGVHDLALG
ncbi:hypothetical protein HDA32_003762 [Spinactinospora alkalitolerans]|uniref:Mycothiol-dependent maleylpyruvate isomerase metal-binding domain-containing protein n=1 Tax=Spinactinospora alkalitolerans TaxID=687207 RepID=A0A852TZZ7_9ACTN|nr:maleylpyruvate isomerase N-terminal domain-containing protein [Spinactinospora alkalitolerans]NYE48642.1 hypothetical protein [Spinactinospora alkalitolerans]